MQPVTYAQGGMRLFAIEGKRRKFEAVGALPFTAFLVLKSGRGHPHDPFVSLSARSARILFKEGNVSRKSPQGTR
jgi:hypothetical protein